LRLGRPTIKKGTQRHGNGLTGKKMSGKYCHIQSRRQYAIDHESAAPRLRVWWQTPTQHIVGEKGESEIIFLFRTLVRRRANRNRRRSRIFMQNQQVTGALVTHPSPRSETAYSPVFYLGSSGTRHLRPARIRAGLKAPRTVHTAGTVPFFFSRRAARAPLFDRMKSAMRGAISARKREPLNTP
jgi:hypothetical protein